MTTQLAPLPVFKAFDNNGNPLVGGQLFTYVAGTLNPQATYVDSTQTTQNTNPVVLNSRGEANVWLVTSQTYKLTLTDASGNQIWVIDNIAGGFNLTAQMIGLLINPRTQAEINANVTPVNYVPAAGVIDRYAVNTIPGTTDMSPGFIAAIAQNLQVGGASITVAGQYYVGSNITIPAGATLQALDSGSIIGPSTVTFTINGELIAPRVSIFPGPWPGGMPVVFGQGCCAEAYPEWFGAVANASPSGTGTDSTAALTALFTACSGGSLSLLTGVGVIAIKLASGYYLTSNQVITPNFTLRGTGRKTSGFVAKNGTSGVWFTDNGNAAGIILEDFAWYGNSANCPSMTYIGKFGYNIQHGSEGYFKGLWPRDCACSGGGWHLDINANIGFYSLISIYGPTSPPSGANLLRVVGVGNILQQIAVLGAGANAYSVYLNGYGNSVHGLEIESPGSCSSSFAPLSIQENAWVYGCIISLNNASATTFDHLIEVNTNAYSWAVEGLQYFNTGGLGTVSGGNIFLINPGTYTGGTLQTTANNQQGTGSYTSGISNVLSGTATFAGTSSQTIALPAGQTVSSYKVALTAHASTASSGNPVAAPGSRTANQFVISFANAYTGTVDWAVTL